MAEGVDEPFSDEAIRRTLTHLLDGWAHDQLATPSFSSKRHVALVGTVYALTAHAHRLGHAVHDLLDAGFTIEIIPLVRSAYESALTASWIAQVPDALPAYLNRNHNQQKALRDTIHKAGWDAGAQTIPADEIDPYLVSRPSKDGATYVNKLCADFLGGDGMYSLYRGMSWMTHPTAAVTDYYLELRDGIDLPALHVNPKITTDGPLLVTWIHVLCSSLVWSARALNLIDAERASTNDRKRLRDAAKQLHINEFLRIDPQAKFRGERAERLRTRSAAP